MNFPLQPEINRRMAPWGDAEFLRFAFRVELFKRRGVEPALAEFTADVLALRDQEHDDRRLCLECANLQKNGACFAAAQGRLPQTSQKHHPVRALLQRCEGFEWQKP
jgi:hypothetical protein